MDIVSVAPKLWLQEEFNRRRSKNPSYSLRAFANYLKLPPGRLSQILTDKRALTPNLGEKISERLGFDPLTKQKFIQCIKIQKQRKNATKIANKLSSKQDSDDDFQAVDMDKFYLIADRYHFALLSLIQTEDFKNDTKWIAKRLNISVVQVRSAFERLQRLNLIKKEKNQFKLTSQKGITTSHDVSSTALRKSHHQALDQAKISLDQDPVETRDFTSITMAIDPNKLHIAKEMIKNFRRKLCKILESENKKEVYDLNIQLVPVTRIIKGENNL
ncbi:MAG: hypothetical protein A3F16_01735 [Deltaproteobacteria bacterium RIFCSPHIGHO2_12_FULL_43_9]|nr:MAG: hypothetical protein A3F16_01735 [Deltaproteobacteria bacterium RIFCSPHIGHO2_12_FULL_43_9]